MSSDPSWTPAAALVALLAGSALAGCMGGGDGGGPDLAYTSFQDALDAPGKVYAPTNTESPVRLKLLEPATPSSISTGNLTVTVLLYNRATMEPVTDASFVLDARMPSMGHGTSPEGNPTHVRFGVYRGFTSISMPGDWVVNVEVFLADGTRLTFAVDATVGSGGMDMGGGHGSNSTYDPRRPYPSYDAAVSAPGPSFQPLNVTPVEDTTSAQGTVQGLAYRANHSFVVAHRSVSTMEVQVTFNGSAPTDELNVSVHDPTGQYLRSATLTGMADNATLAWQQAPAGGNYTINVTGQSLDASYTVETLVRYEAPNLKLKVLEPVNLGDALTGKRVFMVLLRDVGRDAPVTNADVNLASRMPSMGHGTHGEEDPTHEFHGQYVGRTNFSMPGDWIVELDVSLPTGESYEWEIAVTAKRPDDGSSGGGSMDHSDS